MTEIRAISFYLPQYHPVPENDEWWGKGFTEWTNVTRATPKFNGHYQPHLPEELGFYDLRLPETRQAQADLAREHGIHGFCYYHYWFNGRRILEQPFNEVLESQKPDFPFCLCWANENWTRAWDGNNRDVLLQQNYSHQDDIDHIRSLIPAFKDKRYIRINNKPLFLVYRSHLLPNPIETARIWREEAEAAGLEGIYLARVEDYESVKAGISAKEINFDADVEFPPFSWSMGNVMFRSPLEKILCKLGILPKQLIQNTIIDYEDMAQGILNRPASKSVRFPGVSPSWDNSARRKIGANIFTDSSPAKYQAWLEKATEKAVLNPSNDEHIVFINAWNEWAEGNHLEPDLKWGNQYLKATQQALTKAAERYKSTRPETTKINEAKLSQSPRPETTFLRAAYWRLTSCVKQFSGLYKYFRLWK
ncbi:MAG: glycoside hydrolase family 99-like domain-containing protein [Gammaproteobacteria bacterium]|nr:glycoside hydrolase family 99-like domain-containing protein [Gammaproteobacteria bacterium]MBQ0838666.1 glycoside hydrolase family 99-like domain-containing protein [Gammaproteobacteria bacterium]